jgi:8-oxo-dGTP pyrophosphatase MutT (NUDIX family)
MMKISYSLKQKLENRQRKILDRPRRAAILVPIIEDQYEPRILLTRRSETLNHHKGEVAFPGGFFEETDASLEETALREALEEIGLPSSAVEIIGRHDDLFPVSASTAVTPIVGVLKDLPPLCPNPKEVAKVFTIPIKELIDPQRWTMKWKVWEELNWPIFYFEHQGETLWGMSAYVTLLTLHHSHLGAPVDMSWLQLKHINHQS